MPIDEEKYNPDYNPPGYDPKKDAIDLVAYDSAWPNKALLEIKNLHLILSAEHIIDIQHVGSTAIPGMLAKPIIDIQIAVDSVQAIKQQAISILEKAGYVFWYGNPDKERLFFVKGMPPFGDRRTHHVHIVEQNSQQWKNKLMFRDYLRGHPEAVKEYEAIKKKLAEKYTYEREEYTQAKAEFVNHILKLANLDFEVD